MVGMRLGRGVGSTSMMGILGLASQLARSPPSPSPCLPPSLVTWWIGRSIKQPSISSDWWAKSRDDWSCHALGEDVRYVVFGIDPPWTCHSPFYAFLCVVVVLDDEFVSG